jgi:hypothetical protein
MILDSTGSTVASFEDELAARASLHAIVAVEPDAADHLVLLAYGDDGIPIGDACTVWDMSSPVTMEASEFVEVRLTQSLIRRCSRFDTRYFPGAVPAGWGARVDDAQIAV